MKVSEFKNLLNGYEDDVDMIFACENCLNEYDVECGSFQVHRNLNNKPVQLIFTINDNL